jgi:lipopolysaccharide heptosyltransferase I
MTAAIQKKYKKIAVIRLTALGDIVHAIPAVHLLRHIFPGTKICWFAEPAGAKLLQLMEGIDEVVPTNLKVKGLTNKWQQVKRIISQYKNQFDLILDFQGLLKSAILGHLLKGHVLGFGKPNLKESQARFFYSQQATPFDEKEHVIFKNIHLVKQLLPDSMPITENQLVEYPLKPLFMSTELEHFLQQNDLQEKQFLILNIGGGWETKTLSKEQYIETIEHIKSKYKVVILWGNRKEHMRAKEIADQTGVLLTPLFEFQDLALFIRSARMIVSADTLAMHIADMVNTPSVGIFGPTSPKRNGSLLPGSDAVYENLPCGFCYKKKCGTIDCIKKISIAKIIQSIELTYEKHS